MMVMSPFHHYMPGTAQEAKNGLKFNYVDACCRNPKLDEKDSIVALSSAPH